MDGLMPDDSNPIDPIEVIERLSRLLDAMATHHEAGRAWGDLHLPCDALLAEDFEPLDLLLLEPPPMRADVRALRADHRTVRRMVVFAASVVRTDVGPIWFGAAVADALDACRRGPSMRMMRAELLRTAAGRLGRCRQALVRNIASTQTADIRLDAWAHVGSQDAAALRGFLGGLLDQASRSITTSRARLGRLIEHRTQLDDSLDRLDALMHGRARRDRPSTAPLVVIPTPPRGRAAVETALA